MAKYIGIDYGTSMIKAAATDDVLARPTLLNLDPPSFLLPSAIELSADGNTLAIGEKAFRHRRRVDCHVASSFRDRVASPDDSVAVAGFAVDGTRLQANLFSELSDRVQTAAGGTIEAITVTVPDHWPPSAWSLPVAIAQAGWRPSMLVREWVAMLAMQESIGLDEIVFLSAGAGAARAVVCKVRNGIWRAVTVASEPRVCGHRLRDTLSNQLSQTVVQRLRKDPREDAVEDQVLHDGVEMAMRSLCTQTVSQVNVQLFGRPFSQNLTRDDVARAAAPFRSSLEELVRSALNSPAVKLTSCPIVAWGELALLLPFTEWLAELNSKRPAVQIAPLDSVAAGAARIAAINAERGLAWWGEEQQCVSMIDGRHSAKRDGVVAHDSLVVLESAPVALAEPAARRQAWLVVLQIGGTERRAPISANQFRLGRHSDCEMVFDFTEWDSVSGRHAEIVRDGGDYTLADLESTNGTYINDSEIRRKIVLKPGDVIGLGREGPRIRFEIS